MTFLLSKFNYFSSNINKANIWEVSLLLKMHNFLQDKRTCIFICMCLYVPDHLHRLQGWIVLTVILEMQQICNYLLRKLHFSLPLSLPPSLISHPPSRFCCVLSLYPRTPSHCGGKGVKKRQIQDISPRIRWSGSWDGEASHPCSSACLLCSAEQGGA